MVSSIVICSVTVAMGIIILYFTQISLMLKEHKYEKSLGISLRLNSKGILGTN